jgi:hypothetical protein
MVGFESNRSVRHDVLQIDKVQPQAEMTILTDATRCDQRHY